MKSKPILLTVPAYLADFRCPGADCEDHCCYGWEIEVDRATYRRYRQMKDTPLAALLARSVQRNRRDPFDARYAVIRREGDDCPFLTRGRLCRIHAELGEAFLPDVCAVFPRRWRARKNGIEGSASLACPEIARLALEHPDSLRPVRTRLTGPMPRAVAPPLPSQAEAAGMKLRELALALIGNRRYPVWERLLRFGMACEAAGRKPPAGIPALLESFGRQLDDPALDRILADTPVLTGLQLQIVRRLHDEKLPSVRVRTFQECTAAAFAGLDWPAGRPFDAAVNRRYDRAYEQFYQPFFERHGHLLENTLANYILHYDPGFQPGRIYEDYLGLVLHFAMLKTYLIGMAASEGADFSPARVVRLVCAFTKVMEPDAAFRRFALDLLAQSGCTDLLRVAVLLRN